PRDWPDLSGRLDHETFQSPDCVRHARPRRRRARKRSVQNDSTKCFEVGGGEELIGPWDGLHSVPPSPRPPPIELTPPVRRSEISLPFPQGKRGQGIGGSSPPPLPARHGAPENRLG